MELFNTSDIITYKVDNNIVYGYLNQKALDLALYNRAKERTHNFLDKDQWESERSKRPIQIFDISIQRHSILFRPVSDGEYVSEGDVLLDIGLKPSSYCGYFSEHNISEYETWISCGIRVYSNYSGFFYNRIEDNIIGSCNLGNTVSDSDLLFTINLASIPNGTSTSNEDISFSFKMLSRDFLDKIPCLRDISINRWLVSGYTNVKEGDDILEITDYTTLGPRFRTTIKSPFSGFLVKRYTYLGTKLKKGDILFSIYSEKTKLKEDYPNEIRVYTDEFTKTVTVKGRKCGGNALGFKMDTIYINFECVAGKNLLLLRFDRKEINLNKKCKLHLLLGDDSVITLNAIANPVKVYASDSIIKFKLSLEDVIKLKTEKFIKWQITNEEDITIETGMNNCCLDSDDSAGITQNLSYEVFQQFIDIFYNAIKKNVPEEQKEVIADNKEKDKRRGKESCFVYLMVDTTNHFHKIGISNHPKYREHTLQSDKPTIELLCAKEYPSRTIAEAIESALHKAFFNKRIRGEWFNLDTSDIEDIKQTLK